MPWALRRIVRSSLHKTRCGGTPPGRRRAGCSSPVGIAGGSSAPIVSPVYKLGWRTQPRPRLSFRLDDTHPLGGSHHQKVVVVDDAVAFVGGLDLTHGRWDTPRHSQDEPNRRDAQGRPSRANHDVQAIVDGAAARALGDPVAPFSTINAVAGASHIRLRDFLLGTAMGMAPGIAVAAVVADRVRATVERPGFGTVAVLTAVMVATAAAVVSIWQRFGKVTSAGTTVTTQQAGPPEANTEECRVGGASH